MILMLVMSAWATEWKEVTCTPDCVVIIGKKQGPVTSVRYPIPLQRTSFVFAFFDTKGPNTYAHMQMRFRRDEHPAWISTEKESETVYNGLVRGPTFAEVGKVEVGSDGKVYIGAYDGEVWKKVVWDPSEGTLIFEEDLLRMGDDAIRSSPAPTHR